MRRTSTILASHEYAECITECINNNEYIFSFSRYIYLAYIITGMKMCRLKFIEYKNILQKYLSDISDN